MRLRIKKSKGDSITYISSRRSRDTRAQKDRLGNRKGKCLLVHQKRNGTRKKEEHLRHFHTGRRKSRRVYM